MRGCVVEGCNRRHAARGYCRPHYWEWRVTTDDPAFVRFCCAPGCDTRIAKGELCPKHRDRLARHGRLETPVPPILQRLGNIEPPPAPDGPHIPLYVGSTKAARGLLVAYALVDGELVDQLARTKWTIHEGYAVRSTPKPNTSMHRLLLGLAHGDPRQGDHIDRNRLNNRRSNLRIVPARHQAQNMSPHRDGSSRYRGVSFHKLTGKWQAYTNVGGRRVYLGVHPTQEAAAEVALAARLAAMPVAVD